MKNLTEIFNKDVIKHLQNNKHEITSELLSELRSHGNVGKQIALDILDLNKDNEQYYLDAYGNRISFDGNRRLKKSFTKLDLAPIHIEEMRKCIEDIHYFKDNYVKIKTRSGVNFPDMRNYQNEFLDVLADDNIDSLAGLLGRQSGKSITTAIYLANCICFKQDINIGIVGNKGAQAREFLANTKNILIELPIWMQPGTESWNKSSIGFENGMRILTDVPTSDAFRGYTIAILVVDECAFIRPTVWEEFADSIFPSQSALSWKKNLILSTSNGMNHFYEIIKGARKGENGYIPFEVDWKEVPRFDKDGNQLKPEEFMNSIVKKHGIQYWNQNFACQFLGSSHTLISAEKLKAMKAKEPEEIRDGKLKIYHYPEKGHNYIMSVDPAKDGRDAFAVQIVDITDFNFRQVASANLQIDYLLMPEFIADWCEYYNNPYLIIENNEGAGQSIADQMYQSFEYENLHFDRKIDTNVTNITKSKKSYPGFRTTPKSRKQILQTLKLFIENDKLEINDNGTIQEFFQFILIKNKYQADDGARDDMIMSLALVFAPFMSTKNFDDMKILVKNLYDQNNLSEEEKTSFSEQLVVGGFDAGTDEEWLESKREYGNFGNEIFDINEFG